MKRVLFILFLALASLNSCKKEVITETINTSAAIYSVTETWTEGSIVRTNPVFTILVTISSLDNNRLLLNNFANYGMGYTVYATLSGSSFVIPRQSLSNNRVIQGDGTDSGGSMTYTYTETVGGVSVTIKAVAQKL